MIAAVHLHGVVVRGRDAAVAGDVLVQPHMHQAVFGQGVHLAGLGLARFELAQRLGDRHLIHQDLALAQGGLRDAVTGLDHRRLGRALGGRDPGGAHEEAADADRIRRVVGTLVDDLQHVPRADHAGRDLHAAGTPAIGERHLAGAERRLIAGNGDRLEDGPADHPLRLLVQIGEVVTARRRASHSAASLPAAAAARMPRTVTSSDWKST